MQDFAETTFDFFRIFEQNKGLRNKKPRFFASFQAFSAKVG